MKSNMMPSKIVNVLAVVVLIVLSTAIFANSMAKEVGRDEHTYCTAGVLMSQGKMIYKDFAYPAQMPNHPLLYASLFIASDTTHYLLTARIFSVFCDVLVVVCIIGIYRHIFGAYPVCGTLLGLAAAILYVFNPTVDYANGFAWNNDVVAMCVILAFWLFISIDFSRKSKYWRIAAIGALLTFATCMRITTALVQLLFFVFLLARPADSAKARIKNILPFLAATAVLLIRPIQIIASAPKAAFINLFRIPVLNSEFLQKMGQVHNKFDLIKSSLTAPGYLVIIALAVCLFLVVVLRRRSLTVSNKGNLLLAALLAMPFFIIALILPEMWRQHLAPPVPFLIIVSAYPLLYLKESIGSKLFKMSSVSVAACVFISVAFYPVALSRISKLSDPQSWTPIQLHRISEDIADKLGAQESKLILTLGPLYVLEAGCDIYPEMAGCPFTYRVAHLLSPDDRRLIKAAGPRHLQEMLEEAPPAAILLGAEDQQLESPIFMSFVFPMRQTWKVKYYEKTGLMLYFKH